MHHRHSATSRVFNVQCDAHRRLHHIAHCRRDLPRFTRESVRREIAEENRGRAGGRAGDRASGENEKRLSSTWIGSGAEKELPARRRRVQTRLSAPAPLASLSHCLLMVIAKSTLVHFRPFVPRKRPPHFRDRARTYPLFFATRTRRKFHGTNYVKNTFPFYCKGEI